MTRRLAGALATVLLVSACGERPSTLRPIFIEGRAAEAVGDSLIGITRQGVPGLLVLDIGTGAVDTLGTGVLASPVHVQWLDGRWYVSDVEDGRPAIVVLTADGRTDRRIELGDLTDTPHQFAVLPNGHIVVPIPDRRLMALEDDTLTTFALTEDARRPGLLIAASGGVIHAVPDQTITLYNEFGNIRWRVEWPWRETAYVSDLAVDGQGRPHVMAGIPSDGGTFIVYTLARETGEVWRWSAQVPTATFVVSGLGEVLPDSAGDWVEP